MIQRSAGGIKIKQLGKSSLAKTHTLRCDIEAASHAPMSEAVKKDVCPPRLPAATATASPGGSLLLQGCSQSFSHTRMPSNIPSTAKRCKAQTSWHILPLSITKTRVNSHKSSTAGDRGLHQRHTSATSHSISPCSWCFWEDRHNKETLQCGSTPRYSRAPTCKPSSELQGQACSLVHSHVGVWRAAVSMDCWGHICQSSTDRLQRQEPARACCPNSDSRVHSGLPTPSHKHWDPQSARTSHGTWSAAEWDAMARPCQARASLCLACELHRNELLRMSCLRT